LPPRARYRAWIELFLAGPTTPKPPTSWPVPEGIIDLRERYRQAAAAVGTPNALWLVELGCENPP
jgi:hypothetical protein